MSDNSSSNPGEYISYEDRSTTLLGLPVKIKHTPAAFAKDVFNHNKHNQFSQIIFVGVSGSGKTTARQCIIHELHNLHNYAIHYYSKHDIENLASILKKLQVGQDCILAFDDVSFLFQEMKPAEVFELLHELTVVRHRVKAKVIVMLSIHYSYGILKGLRQAPFRVICSATDEERDNYNKIFGYHNKKNVKMYITQYRNMLLHDRFKVNAPPYSDKPFWDYVTDQPFRLAMVSSLGNLHYLIYHKVDCGVCAEGIAASNDGAADRDKTEATATGIKSISDLGEDDFAYWEGMVKKHTLQRLVKCANLYTYMKTGQPTIPFKDLRCLKQLNDYFEENKVDIQAIAKVLKVLKKEMKELPESERNELVMFKLKETVNKLKEKLTPEKIDPEQLKVVEHDPVLDYHGDAEDFEDDDDDDAPSGPLSSSKGRGEEDDDGDEEDKDEEDDGDDKFAGVLGEEGSLVVSNEDWAGDAGVGYVDPKNNEFEK